MSRAAIDENKRIIIIVALKKGKLASYISLNDIHMFERLIIVRLALTVN